MTSWQGWVVSAVFVGMTLAVEVAWGDRAWPAIIGIFIIYIVIMLVTGDPPGFPRRPDKNDRAGSA